MAWEYEALKNATDIRTASDIVLHQFEAPADQSEAVTYDGSAGRKKKTPIWMLLRYGL